MPQFQYQKHERKGEGVCKKFIHKVESSKSMITNPILDNPARSLLVLFKESGISNKIPYISINSRLVALLVIIFLGNPYQKIISFLMNLTTTLLVTLAYEATSTHLVK